MRFRLRFPIRDYTEDPIDTACGIRHLLEDLCAADFDATKSHFCEFEKYMDAWMRRCTRAIVHTCTCQHTHTHAQLLSVTQ